MLIRITILISSVAALGCRAPNTTHSSCKTDGMNTQYLAIIRREVANDSSRKLFMLPRADSAEINLVTDPAVCARAGLAMTPRRVGPLYVFRIRSTYAVVVERTGADTDGIYYFGPDWQPISNELVQ